MTQSTYTNYRNHIAANPLCAVNPLRVPSRILVALLMVSLLSGCSLVINRTVGGFSKNLTSAVLDQNDPETVRQAIPAYLVLLDSFVQGDPENASSLRRASTLYSAYGSTLVDDPDRASKLTSRAWNYSQKSLCLEFKIDCEIRSVGFDDWNTFLEARSEKDVPRLFDFGTSWLAFLQAHSSDFVTLAELPKAQKLIETLDQINNGFEEVNISLYLGILNSLRPPALGGDFDTAQKFFEQAIEMSEGKNLTAKVSYARFYARTLYERELHDQLLTEVIEADPADGSSTLQNVLAQDEAKLLLESGDEYF